MQLIFFTKEPITNDGSETLLTKDDRHHVFVRAKAFVPSNGSVWASETVRLRHMVPDAFEVDVGTSMSSSEFRSCCAKIHDTLYLHCDMCEEHTKRKGTVIA